MASLSIGEVARQAGLRPSAIRYYESLGILPVPQRVNGRRRYDADVLHLLQAIGIAKQAGLSVAELQQLFGADGQDQPPSVLWQQFAGRKLAEVDALIERAYAMKAMLELELHCGCLGWDACILFGQDKPRAQEGPESADI